MESVLLYDPLIMGHHLVYAENFTAWALSRGLKVYFCGYHYQNSLFHRRFAGNPQVEFLELDTGLFAHRASFGHMAQELGEIAFYYDRIRPLLYDDDGPAIQVEFLKNLQRRLRPEFTLILYGDEMWSIWRSMAKSGDAFPGQTFLWLLYASGHSYDPRGLHARDIRGFMKEQKIFRAVATSDEYQAARHDPKGRVLRYVPDPYCRLAGPGGEALTGHEAGLYRELEDFLGLGDNPVLLIPGLLEARKNAAWLLGLAQAHDGLSLLALGRKNLPGAVDKCAQSVFERLAAEGRLFTVFSYVPECFLELAMASPRVRILPLPYRRHDVSSGIQLMALKHDLPCLVPDNGLMARRTLEHGLGAVFCHESAQSFAAAAAGLMAGHRPSFAPACESFMTHFSQEAFFAGADRLFGLASGPDQDPLVSEAMAQDARLLGRGPGGADECSWLLHQALLFRDIGRLEDSLACLEKAQDLKEDCTRPVYLRAMFLEEAGRAGCALLNGLLDERPDHPDVAAWMDAQSDAVVKHQPEEESHAQALTRLRRDCRQGPLFPALLEVLSDRVWYHIDRGRHQLADRILRGVLQVEPGQRRAMFILAMNHVRAGQADAARAAFAALEAVLERLLTGDPANVDYLRQRAAVWGQTGRHAEAAEAFADLAHGLGDRQAFLDLSDELRKAGRFDESMRALDQGARLGACTQGVRAQKAARIQAERSARKVSPCLP